MKEANKNFRLIFNIQLIVALACVVYIWFLNYGERDIAWGFLFGIILSILIQALLFLVKPELYGNKNDKV